MAAFWRSGWRLVARPGNLRLAGALLARDSWPSTGALPSCVHRRRGGGEWRGRGLSSSAAPPEGGMRLVYTGPLKGAVRAVKVFSLSTCVLALMGTPVLVVLGNPGVPVPARVAMGSLVLLVGVSTTAVLHWLCKGYITRLFYDKHSHTVAAYTVSLFGLNKKNVFEVEECGPPSQLSAFSTFQARKHSYFVHTDVFEDRKLLLGLQGAHTAVVDSRTKKTWNHKTNTPDA